MDCLFYEMINIEIEKYVIYKDEKILVILDEFPYSDVTV